MYSSFAKSMPVLIFSSSFSPQTPWFIFTSQNISLHVGKYLYTPLSNMGPIIFFLSSIIFFILSPPPLLNYHPNLIISTFGKTKLFIPLWPTESADFTNLSNRTEISLPGLLIFLNTLSQFKSVTTKMIKTFIWHLTYHPLTLLHLLPLLMYTIKLLTPLTIIRKQFKKLSGFNCKHCYWLWCLIIWNTKKK